MATIRLTDRGGGIGRVVVRVNGRGMALTTRGAAIKAGSPVTIDLSVAELKTSGENTIEAIAYGALVPASRRPRRFETS